MLNRKNVLIGICSIVIVTAIVIGSIYFGKNLDSGSLLGAAVDEQDVVENFTAYMKLTGVRQGVIEGSCTENGKSGMLLVDSTENMVSFPTETHTGKPMGQRKHDPYQISLYPDKALPKLYTAVCTGEVIRSVEIQYYAVNSEGEQQLYYTVKMENAYISSVDFIKVPDYSISNGVPSGDRIALKLTYEKITWIYEPEKIEGTDSMYR